MRDEDLRYLREQPGYRRLLEGIAERYRSLGRIGGTVVLRDVTPAERQVLSWHFRRDFSGQRQVSVAVAKFAASLADTRFAPYDLQDMVEAYLGQPLTTKQADQEQWERQRLEFFRRWRERFRQGWTRVWLDAVAAGSAVGVRRVLQAYGRDEASLARSLELVGRALQLLQPSSSGDAGTEGLARDTESSSGRGSVSGLTGGCEGGAEAAAEEPSIPEQAGGEYRHWGGGHSAAFAGQKLGRDVSLADVGTPWRLPVLASAVTKDPHAFDLHTELGQMLVDALCTVLGRPAWQNRQDMLEVLYAAGVVGDEIANYVTCWGLLAARTGESGSGLQRWNREQIYGRGAAGGEMEVESTDVDPVWAAAYATNQVLQVPLAWFPGIRKIWVPGKERDFSDGGAGCGRVFVVENAGVFSAILDAFDSGDVREGRDGLDFGLVCTMGQLKLAGVLLLDHLAGAGMELWYSGDFDPEGLVIAQKLKERYGEQLVLWRYSAADYGVCASGQGLSERRLAMLEGVRDEGLAAVKVAILEAKVAGYQEALVADLIGDIRS